ncbi:MAG: rhodanese-like domain-containing protein [Chitinophagia bacterium]|nr:rhodanese-like domain-containing protein [Chitinophagia bacterium]
MVLSLAQFLSLSQDESVQIIDTRIDANFLQGYIPGSIHVALDEIKTLNALKIIEQDCPIILVCDEGTEEILIKRFELLGYTQVKGYLEGGFPTWSAAGEKIDLVIEVEVDELAMDIPFDAYLMILDIRTEDVYDKGHIKDSINLPLIEFGDPGAMSELDEHFNIYLIDDSGKQLLLAASILKKQGIHNIRIVQDGWEAVEFLKNKFTIVASPKKDANSESLLDN